MLFTLVPHVVTTCWPQATPPAAPSTPRCSSASETWRPWTPCTSTAWHGSSTSSCGPYSRWAGWGFRGTRADQLSEGHTKAGRVAATRLQHGDPALGTVTSQPRAVLRRCQVCCLVLPCLFRRPRRTTWPRVCRTSTTTSPTRSTRTYAGGYTCNRHDPMDSGSACCSCAANPQASP